MKALKYDAVKDHIFVKIPVLNERHHDQPLNTIDCLVYGYLVYLARNGNGATQTEVCKSLRLDRNACKRSLRVLGSNGLVTTVGQKLLAVEPANQAASLFRIQKQALGTWQDRFVYDKVYLPVSSSVLSVRANVLFWHLVKLGEPVENQPGYLRVGGSKNRFLTDRYLAIALNCDRKTTHSCLRRLEKLKLIHIHPYSKGFAVGVFPLDSKEGMWRQTWKDKPKEVPPLSVNELFGLPSPVEVKSDFPWEDKVRKILRGYGIRGQLCEELTEVLIKEDVDLFDWKNMLRQASVDHSCNQEDGRVEIPHCGYLFRHNLREYISTRNYKRVHNPKPHVRSACEIRLGEALGSLPLSTIERDLVESAIAADYLTSDDGERIPCTLDLSNAIECAENANGSKKAFRTAVAGLLFGEHILKAGRWRWYREWTRNEEEILPNTELLEDIGIELHMIEDVRDRLRYIRFKDFRREDHGDVTSHVNHLTMVASWQMYAHGGQNEQQRLLNAAQDIVEAAGLVASTSDKEVTKSCDN